MKLKKKRIIRQYSNAYYNILNKAKIFTGTFLLSENSFIALNLYHIAVGGFIEKAFRNYVRAFYLLIRTNKSNYPCKLIKTQKRIYRTCNTC